MTDFDTIVVGAGPAGSSAAYFLAKSGAKVCILDKKKFPRDKTCGDALTAPSLRVLERMGLGDWVKNYNRPEALLLSGPNYESVAITLPDNFCYGHVIPRLQLDDKLLQQAIKVGAHLIEETQPVKFERLSPETVCLTIKYKERKQEGKLKSKMVIAADGAHGSFTKSLGLMTGSPDLVAVRAYFEGVDISKNILEIHFDPVVMPGYAWIFPMNGDRANVGIGTIMARTKRREVNLKAALHHFLARNPYAKQRLKKGRMIGGILGFPIRSKMSNSTPYTDNVLVVGEAAGVVDPITGDGISEALETGEFAAHQTLSALKSNKFSKLQLAPYGNFLKKRYGFNHNSALLIRNLLSYHAIMNRTIKRAQHDSTFALNLCHIIVGFSPAYTLLYPDNLLKIILS